MCNGKSNAGMIERAVSVRPAHVQRADRSQNREDSSTAPWGVKPKLKLIDFRD